MRVYHGMVCYTFDEVPVAYDGKPAWASGRVWYEYKQVEGRDDGRSWVETDYKLDHFDGYEIYDENGNELPRTKDIDYDVTQWLYSHRNDDILQDIDDDCHEFM